MSFFSIKENNQNEDWIEYHYLSSSTNYGIIKKSDTTDYYDNMGILKKQESNSDLTENFSESDFKRLISEKIHKTIYGEKYSNIVFLAGAGASVVNNNQNYGKTVKMIADDIFKKLHKSKKFFTLEELAHKCKYKDGNILAINPANTAKKRTLDDSFNLEDFLSTLFHYRPYALDSDIEKMNKTIEKILLLIKENTNYSFDSSIMNHGKLLNLLSNLSWKDGNKFSVITTNYDLLIEEAAASNNFVIFDGFNFTPLPKFDSNMFEWNLVREVQNINTREVEFKEKTFNLVKIHGSLSWEKQDNGDILRKNKDSITDTEKMVMIFPSSDKFAQSYQEPYFELFTKFQELIKRPNTLLISSGFSFADVHISKMIFQALKNNTSLTLLVTDYNISPNRVWNEKENKYISTKETNSNFNQNWEDLICLMNQGYSVSFLKATMNNDLVDYLSGRYLND
ncbi:MAG: SIR2 family protein [Streptococcus sp.]|nr:SIR2 family protein [Streptococcus sp.]